MGQRRGELGVSQVARLLEVNPKTVRRWANSETHAHDPPLERVRRDVTGRLWFDRVEVLSLRGPRDEDL